MTRDLSPERVPEDPEHPTLSIRMPATLPGTEIGHYKLVRQLGEGGMGVVYLAHQTQPIHREVALKVIKPGMDSKQVIARFEGERQALAIMDHANIARVFDAGTTAAGLPYFVMELVDGIPITRYCDSKGLTLKERIELCIPVCRAIQHAHQKGIIHRDIKPSNVLVTQQENQVVPKVIDFGLAKALGDTLSDATIFGGVVGTFQYMSPEQAELGRKDIDTRSDVYSLGALLYELITGTTPLEYNNAANPSYVEMLNRIREEQPERPSTRLRQSAELKDVGERRPSDAARLPKRLDHELDWIVMKALEKDRTRRYETVNGMARDLQRYLAGEPLEAAPPSTTYRMSKFVRRHRVWLATAAAFTTLLLAGIAVSSLMAIRASRAQQEAVLERNTAKAVTDFLQNDLLAQASARKQASPDSKPDPDLKVRTVLDRAAAGIEGKFAAQPVMEASIRQTLGEVYKDLGLYPQAQRQMERSLDLRRRVLGEENPDTLTSMNNVASLYVQQGKYTLAEPLRTKVLEVQRRVLGEEHPDTLNSLGSLGSIYTLQGKYGQAEPIATKVLELRRRVLGAEHPDTLTSMNNLANLYGRQGKYTQSEPLQTKVLEVQRRVLGEEHPFTQISINNLATLYKDQGKYTQAEPLLTNVLEAQHRVLGDEHPDALESINVLAELFVRERKYSRAQRLYTKALEAERRVLGKEHPSTLKTLVAIGRLQLLEERYAEAGTTLREALKGNERTRPETWERYDCLAVLGASLAGQREYLEAEPLLLSGYAGLIQRGSERPASDLSSLAEAGQWIVKLYQSWGKPEKTEEWRQKLQATSPH